MAVVNQADESVESIESLVHALDSRRPKILQVLHSNPNSSRGGIEVYVNLISRELASLLPNAHIMCLYPELDNDIHGDNQSNLSFFPVYFGSGERRRFTEVNPFNNLRFLRQFTKLLPQIDIVHIQHPFYIPSIMLAAASSMAHKPLVITSQFGEGLLASRSLRNRVGYLVFRGAYSMMDPMHLVVSRDGANVVQSQAIYISSCISSEFDKASDTEFDEGILTDLERLIGSKRPILHVASIYQRKNQLATLEAFNSLIKSGREDLHCVFVYGFANLTYKNKLDAYIRQEGLGRYVSFYGPIPHDKIKAAYKLTSDKKGIFILPSEFEGKPLTIMEAMGFGIPIVTVNQDGMKDMVSDSRNGFLVDTPYNTQALAYNVSALLDDPLLYQRISDGAYHESRNYSLHSHIIKLMVVYSSLLGLRIPKSSSGLPFFDGVLTPDDHLMPR
ncbi:glycosyltransferase family 4 protein [Candidatus Woesearchaeota archaeon]|nr:glycosyltransferase family 4 protein [Candidatus Woesearchaeota archaeon]